MPMVRIKKDIDVHPISYRVLDGNNVCFVDEDAAKALLSADAAELTEGKELPDGSDEGRDSASTGPEDSNG